MQRSVPDKTEFRRVLTGTATLVSGHAAARRGTLGLAQIGATLHVHEQPKVRRAQASGSQEPVGQIDPNHREQHQARVVRVEAGGGAKLPRGLAVQLLQPGDPSKGRGNGQSCDKAHEQRPTIEDPGAQADPEPYERKRVRKRIADQS